jgi:LPXTG-site transpeptidase (sortase) family protein
VVKGKRFLVILFFIFLVGCGEQSETSLGEMSNGDTENYAKEIEKSEEVEKSEQTTVQNQSFQAKPNGPLQEEINGIVPSLIEIPAIGVNAEIEKVGRLDNGQMGVPKGMDTVGWFEPGLKPGERGNAVMAGHVDSKTGPAVFFKLDELKKGDEVIVTDQAGESKVFVVIDKKSYPRKDAPVEDIFDFSYSKNLNLITCTGEFNRDARTHEERLVVYTVLKEE